jgi:hypothetical protein
MEQLQWLMYKLLESHFESQHNVIVSNKKINNEQLCQHRLHKSICSICSPNHVKPAPRCVPVSQTETRTVIGTFPTLEQINHVAGAVSESGFMGNWKRNLFVWYKW